MIRTTPVLALLVLLLAGCGAAPDSRDAIAQSRLYTCAGESVVEPKTDVLACGDGNAWLDQLRWRAWSSQRATGSGLYHVNDCMPDCAEGHFRTYKASVLLDRPVSTPRGVLFARLSATFSGPGPTGQRSLVDDDLMPHAWTHPSTSP